MTDFCHLPAHELVRLMSTGAVSCREVTEAHLARIEGTPDTLSEVLKSHVH